MKNLFLCIVCVFFLCTFSSCSNNDPISSEFLSSQQSKPSEDIYLDKYIDSVKSTISIPNKYLKVHSITTLSMNNAESRKSTKIQAKLISDNDPNMFTEIKCNMELNGQELATRIYYDNVYSYMDLMGLKSKFKIDGYEKIRKINDLTILSIPKASILKTSLSEQGDKDIKFLVDPSWVENELGDSAVNDATQILMQLEDIGERNIRLMVSDAEVEFTFDDNLISKQIINFSGYVLLDKISVDIKKSIETEIIDLGKDFLFEKPDLSEYKEVVF